VNRSALSAACLALAMAALALGDGADVVFEDTFDATALGPSWQRVAGDWSIVNGELTNAAPRSGTVIAGGRDWADYTLVVTLTTQRPGPKPWSVARVLFRYTDPGNYYYVLLHTSRRLELGREYGGAHQPGLAVVEDVADPLQPHRLRAALEGPRVRIWVDDRPVVDFTDDLPLAGGKVGLDAFQDAVVRFDDVRVISPTIARAKQEAQAMATEALAKLNYRPSEQGNIAIFRDPHVPIRDSAPSDPEYLGRLLQSAGYGVTYVQAGDLGSDLVLARANFDLVILPYGSAFPAEAIPAFTQFLKSGGGLITLGGYFADHLYRADGEAEDGNLLANPGFEAGITPWQLPSPGALGLEAGDTSDQARSGARSAFLRLPRGSQIAFHSLLQRVEGLAPGTALVAEAWIRTDQVTDGAGAYLAINYFRDDGERIKWDQSPAVTGTSAWRQVTARGEVPPGCAYATVNLLLHGYGTAWFGDALLRPAVGGLACLNTREGDIHGPGNSLRVSPDQIGLFDPGYRLEEVVELRPSAGQSIADPGFTLKADLQGYSASGVFVGNGNPVRAETYARVVPLLDAFDAVGRRRGAAGVLVRNHRGPYAGSDWAAFGVNNRDLFAPDVSGSGETLLGLVAEMTRGTFLAEVHPGYACYRQGEEVALIASVANHGRRARAAEVRLRVSAGRDETRVAHEATVPCELPPGGRREVSVSWAPERFAEDFYTVRAELLLDGVPTDRLDNAFVVWNEDALQAGPRLAAGNGYLTRNGRATFLCGTGDAGYPYYAQSENPLVWDDQFRLMRDLGLLYYRCMHFFTAYPSAKPLETLDDLPQEQLRRLDALVYLAHRHGLGFLFVNNVGLQLARDDPEDLAGRQRALRLLARRYANARGVMFNMDHQEFIRATDPAAHTAFRRFLERKYPSFAAFAQAWGLPADGSFDEVKLDEGAARKAPWNSALSLDTAEFLYSYREAWRRNAAEAIHEGNRDTVFDQDFSLYWLPDFPWPAPDTAERLDMVSCHFYGAADRFPLQNKRADLQVLGKPVGQTEFGILTHPAWRGHQDARLDHDSADAFFMMAGHYCLGLGTTMMSNWNWKEMKECIFPWAIAYHDLAPKPHLLAYRNMALLFNSFSPRYTYPEAYVVVPSSHLLTGKGHEVDAALRDCIGRLLSCHVRFGLIDERYLDRLPAEARALFYPIPFCPPDATVQALEAFVRRGGALYFSGDISFDESKQRTRTDRLERLAGARFQAENYPHLDVPRDRKGVPALRTEPRGAQVLVDSPDGPAVLHHHLGEGHVVYSADPIECYAGDWSLPAAAVAAWPGVPANRYDLTLSLGGAARIALDPPAPDVHAFSLATDAGGTVYVLFNTSAEGRDLTLSHGGRKLALSLASHRPALAHFGPAGKLLAIEAQDGALLDGKPLWRGEGHFIVLSLDGVGLDAGPTRLLAMAIGEGKAALSCAGGIADPVVQYGEFRDGRWHTLRTEVAEAGQVSVSAAGPLRSALALVCGRGAADEVAAGVTPVTP